MAPKMTGMVDPPNAPASAVRSKSRSPTRAEKKLEKQKTMSEKARSHVVIEDGYELKIFPFEEGTLGMKFGGKVDHGVAIVHVAEVLPETQAHTLGVPVGSIIKLIGKSDITKVNTMAQVIKAIGAALRPVEITMAVPLPKEEPTGEGAVPAAAPEAVETEEEKAARIEADRLEAEQREAERLEAERLAAEAAEAARLAAIEAAKRAEEERLKAIARAKREAEEAERRKEEEARRVAAEKEAARKAAAATVIQRRQRGIGARKRFVVKKRMRALRPPDALDLCCLKGQARPALTVILAQRQIMASYPKEQRARHNQLLRKPEYLEAQVTEYLEAMRVEEESVRELRLKAEQAEASLKETQRRADFKAEQARLANEQAAKEAAAKRTDLQFAVPGAATLQEARANLASVPVPAAVAAPTYEGAATEVIAAAADELAGIPKVTLDLTISDGGTATVSWIVAVE